MPFGAGLARRARQASPGPDRTAPLQSVGGKGRRRRRVKRPRRFFEKWLFESVAFVVLTVGSLLYYRAVYRRAGLDPEAGLSEKQRIRYWDWPDVGLHAHIRHKWNHAVTTVWLPDDDEVAFQLNVGDEHDLSPETGGHVDLPEFFYTHHVFGVSAHFPADDALLVNAEGYNEIAHKELRVDLELLKDPKPAYILEAVYEGRHHGADASSGEEYVGEAKGYAVAYRGTLPEAALRKAKRDCLVWARIYGQMGMYHWYPHQYGEHPRDHAVIIQKVEPTGAAMYRIRTSGPVNRVRWIDPSKQRPYQVDGKGQHTPKREPYPRRRPRRGGGE